MKNLSLIIALLLLLAACGNSGTNKEKHKEELKEEKGELKEEIENEQTQKTNNGDFQWEGTYKYNDQTVIFKHDGSIDATGDFPYNRYMVMKTNDCGINAIGLVYMGIVEFHYKRKGNKIELYHLEMSDCKVKELFGVLEKQ